MFDPATLNRRRFPLPAAAPVEPEPDELEPVAEVKCRPDGRPLPVPPKFLFDAKPQFSLNAPMVRGPKAKP